MSFPTGRIRLDGLLCFTIRHFVLEHKTSIISLEPPETQKFYSVNWSVLYKSKVILNLALAVSQFVIFFANQGVFVWTDLLGNILVILIPA